MRIWTIHPKYLDTKGLLAVWRETLLAQKVLKNETVGYRNHPQLSRFKETTDPVGAVADYLRGVYAEAVHREYNFSEERIAHASFSGQILCTRGQLLYEWNHLKEKLRARDARKLQEIKDILEPEAHPVFKIIEGEIEDWEVINR
jgi:Pyrimidine dimer DNA glycosylase